MSSFGQIRLCSMRAPSSTWTSWKCTVRSSVAECTLTGTKTPAKAIVPFQIERSATPPAYPVAPDGDHGQDTMPIRSAIATADARLDAPSFA